MGRSASSSYKGYTYQRIRLLNLIFCEYYSSNEDQLNSIFFKEEELEDIDIYKTNIINGNNEIHLYQEKYLNSNTNESLNINSGLTKVLISHYDNNKITKINYEVISTTGEINKSNKLEFFFKLINDENNNYLIGKFIILNFCNSKLFSNITNYDKFLLVIKNKSNNNFIEIINDKIKYENDDKNKRINIYKLNEFCHYCNNDENISKLLIYLKKIHFSIQHKDFNSIHNETINKIKNILPEFNNICNIMSNEFNNIYSKTLYGLLNIIIVENLFQNNDKMSIKQLIDILKNIYINGIKDTDKINIVIHTINYFINNDNYNDLYNELFSNNYLTKFIITNKITITTFIKKINIDNNKNIANLIRNIIYEICYIKKYKYIDDKHLLSFLKRTYKNIKFTGYNYKSLENIDNLIINSQ
jgi:hypothetical protein